MASVVVLLEVSVPPPEAGGVPDAVGVQVLLVLLLVVEDGGGGGGRRCSSSRPLPAAAAAAAMAGRGRSRQFELHRQGHPALHALVESIRALDADVGVAAWQHDGVIRLGVELLEAYHAVEGEGGGRHDVMAIIWVVSAVFWGEDTPIWIRSGRVGSGRGGAAPDFLDEFSYLGPDGAPSSEAREIHSLLAQLRDSPVSLEQLLFFEVLPFFNSREREIDRERERGYLLPTIICPLRR